MKAKNLIEAGVLLFEFVGDPIILEVHVFRTEDYEGEPIETEGMLIYCAKLIPLQTPPL